MPDPIGLVITLGFVIVGLSVIPLDQYLEQRRQRLEAQRRNQARPWRKL